MTDKQLQKIKELCNSIQFGEVNIKIQNGKIYLIEEKKTHKI